MDLRSSRVCVAPGDGLVMRQGSAVLVVDIATGGQEPVLDELLELVAEGADDGRGLLRRVGALITRSEPDTVPALGVLVQLDDSVVVLLTGHVTLEATTVAGVEVIDGTTATTYVERVLGGDYDRLWLATSGSDPADLRSSLAGGVVRGGGVLMFPAGSSGGQQSAGGHGIAQGGRARDVTAASAVVSREEVEEVREPAASADVLPPATPGPEAEPAFESFPLFDDATPEGGDHSAGAPVRSGQPATEEDMPAPVTVDGILCSRGHFNSPQSIFCTQCGIAMVQQTHNLVPGVRPPLGVLVTDQGDVFTLDHDYVIGREPETSAEVAARKARPVVVDDPTLAVSRAHLRIILDGWEVRVEDNHSANGTFVAVEDGDWMRLEPGVPATISPGTRIAIGDHVFAFETHQRA